MKNKTAILIHLKTNSKRVKGKNFKKINSVPLYDITFRKLSNFLDYFDVYVDSSSEIFKRIAKKYKFNYIKRPKKLDLPNAQGNELIQNCLPKINNEIIVQLFVTNPFIKVKTIIKVINKLKSNKKFGSITPVTPLYNRYWFNKKEINHKYNKLIGTQYMKPIYIESGLYCFRKKAFLKEKSRISKKNKFYEISDLESFDIDTNLDLIIANNILKK